MAGRLNYERRAVMPKQLIFWAIMLIWLVCGFGAFSPSPVWKERATFGGNIVLFILLTLLGWQVYGPAIQ